MLNAETDFVSPEPLLIDHVFQGFHVRPLTASVLLLPGWVMIIASIHEQGTSSDYTGSELLVISLEKHHIEEEVAEIHCILAVFKAQGPQEELQEADGSRDI